MPPGTRGETSMSAERNCEETSPRILTRPPRRDPPRIPAGRKPSRARHVTSPPRFRIASKREDMGRSRIRRLPSRTNRPGRAARSAARKRAGVPASRTSILSSGAESPRERSGPRTRQPAPSKKISPPSNLSADANARVSEDSRGLSSTLSPSAQAAATSARFVRLLLPGTRRSPERRPRRSGRAALTRSRARGGGRRVLLQRSESPAHRARGRVFLDDRKRPVRGYLGVLPLLEPRGEDVRDGAAVGQRPLDVEVADQERVVSRAARGAAFREQCGLREPLLVPEVRAVEPRFRARHDRARERSGDQLQDAVRDRVLRDSAPEPVRQVGGIHAISMDEGVSRRPYTEAVRQRPGCKRFRIRGARDEKIAVPLHVPQRKTA